MDERESGLIPTNGLPDEIYITTADITTAEPVATPVSGEEKRFQALDEKILATEARIMNEVHMIQDEHDRLVAYLPSLMNRISQCESRLTSLDNLVMSRLANPGDIEQLREDMEWLHQRCDDIQRVFDFDAMIINGIQKQGE